MTLLDAQSLSRSAQFLVAETRKGYGTPPAYVSQWKPLWEAKIDRIEINGNDKPSVATIWFPSIRWQTSSGTSWGDMIRIRTNQQIAGKRTIVFSGFITSFLSDFSGGTGKNDSFERCAIVCSDYRWLLATTSPLYGQVARGPDDYSNYGTSSQSPKHNSVTWLQGQRAIFNRDGKPNKDPEILETQHGDMPIFCDAGKGDPWTARDMIRYCLSYKWNKVYAYLPIDDPNELDGLDHSDWDKVLNDIVIEKLNIVEAVTHICRNIGWGWREEHNNNGTVTFAFYKVAEASSHTRSSNRITILHQLHAPAAGENIATAVNAGKKMLWAMNLAEDIAAVVNNPWALGGIHRFEFTTELVPAWKDWDFVAPNDFYRESDLQYIDDPNTMLSYKYYDSRGSDFRRDVGRKWALNESGAYSSAAVHDYDRGMPFDFATVIPSQYILNTTTGKRAFAPFKRRFLPCLTSDADSTNTIGIKVEFSFDFGETWQIIPAAISVLQNECGIYIEEPNLSEIADRNHATFDEGTYAGWDLTLYTSLMDDRFYSRSFKDGKWRTRVRITASVQMDQRLSGQSLPTSLSGSPFRQSAVYDFSTRYKITERTRSSIYHGGSLPAEDTDDTEYLDTHLAAIRAKNEDMSISGQFTLERLWLGDDSGQPTFKIGDCIEKITGREYPLSASLNKTTVYPEIVQIIYMPDKQMQKLITRDLRFSEVVLE